MTAPSIKRPWTNDSQLGRESLGFLSEWYESSNKGVGHYGKYAGDRGNGGYGPWSLSTSSGIGAFLKSEWGKRYAPRFDGLQPGTKSFDDRYGQIARQDPQGLRRAQHDYIYNAMYRPVAEHARANGFDLSNQAIREAIWSMAVQHGRAKGILDLVVARRGQRGDPTKVLQHIYEARMDYVASLGPSKANIDNIERYAREGRQMLEHDALVRSQPLLHQDLVDVSDPENYVPERLRR